MQLKRWRIVPFGVVLLSMGMLGGCKYTWPQVLPAVDAGPDAETTIDAALDANTTTDATVTVDAAGDPDGAVDSSVDAESPVDAEPPVDGGPPAVCGNGLIESGEVCDDGDTHAGDGCSSTCAIEVGWYCSGAPSTCTTSCGDGVLIASAEECDDGNTTSGDGCNSGCMIDCSNSSTEDCNYTGSTKIANSAFLDPDPPPGFVQCAGFINTVGDDVDRHWELNCLGAVQTLRIRYWSTSGGNWTLRGDGTLSPDSADDYNTQSFDAVSNGGTFGVLQTAGVEFLKDQPGAGVAGATSTVECDVGDPNWNFGANDFYLGSLNDTRTLWVCSGDTTLSGDPCGEQNELALVNASMGACTGSTNPLIDATNLAVAIYYQVP